MTQEERDLLLKDLCARLPYGVKFRYKYIDCFFHEKYGTSTLNGVLPPYRIIHSTLVGKDYLKIEEDEVKPYLFPLSSMTAEQLYELRELFGFEIEFLNGFIDLSSRSTLEYLEMIAIIEWFNKNHFDYRGLIPMGLAIDCTNLNIY